MGLVFSLLARVGGYGSSLFTIIKAKTVIFVDSSNGPASSDYNQAISQSEYPALLCLWSSLHEWDILAVFEPAVGI